MRLTITRAVSGLSGETSHSANPRRRQLDFASGGGGGNVRLRLAATRQHARRHDRSLRVDAAAMQEVGRPRLPARLPRSRAPSGTASASSRRSPRSASFSAACLASTSSGISATMCSSVIFARSESHLQRPLDLGDVQPLTLGALARPASSTRSAGTRAAARSRGRRAASGTAPRGRASPAAAA